MPDLVPIPAEALKETRKCCIALPWYRSANPLTTVALLNLFQKDSMGVSISFGDAFVAHARNKLATRFLDTKFEWLLMLDDDMIPPCGQAGWFNEHTGLNLPEWAAGFNTVERLIGHGKTLVGATYFGRSPGRAPVFAEGKQHNLNLLQSGPVDKIIPVRWIGTGCLLTHRSVFTAIERKFPHLSRENNHGTGQWYSSSEHDMHSAVEEAIKILSPVPGGIVAGAESAARQVLEKGLQKSRVHSGLGMGEDVQFCVRATQSGHQPHVDLGLWAGHVGDAVYPIR